MPKFSAKPEATREAPTRDEYEQFRKDLKRFSLKRINGRLMGAFEQLMEEKGLIRFDKDEGMVMWDTGVQEYSKFATMKSRMDSMDYKQFRRDLEEFPEEKAAWNKKISDFFKAGRKALGDKVRVPSEG